MKKFAILMVLLVLIPAAVLAQSPASGSNACNNGSGTLANCVNQLYIWSMGIAAILALLMIVVGGYITLTSAGNAERASRGKNYIVSSITGIILLLGAYVLLRTINPDLVDFGSNCTSNLTKCFDDKPVMPRSPTPGT
jgi:hypothetical protein